MKVLTRIGMATAMIIGVLLCDTAQADQMCAVPGQDGNVTASGIVNDYFQGNGDLATGDTSLLLGHQDGRAAGTSVMVGNLLLIIQMQDGSFRSANDSTYGDNSGSGQGSLTVGNAGLYEFVTVTAISGANVSFAPALTHAYRQAAATTSSGQKRYQVVRVPQYSSATAAGVLAPAWSKDSGATAETGGVVVLDVRDTLTLDSATVEGQSNRAIFVAGKGFRGAAGIKNTTGNSFNTDWASPATGAHGGKGEGIVGTPRYMAIKTNGWGVRSTNKVANASDLIQLDNGEGYPGGSHARGAPGNAGGGGTDGDTTTNRKNAGGGGGGSYAPGGIGGRGWDSPLIDTGGRGGAGYAGTLGFGRIFMGGGGGSGGMNGAKADAGVYANQGISCGLPVDDGALCASGGAGGGIVIIRARAVTGTGVIDVRGANGYNTGNDAAGGGGAGGVVVLHTVNGGNVSINAAAGDGGNAWASNTGGLANRHGPGGGGGGGFVAFSPSSMLITANLAGGAPGRTANGPDDTYSASGLIAGLSTFQMADVPGIIPGAECITDLHLAKTDNTSTLSTGDMNSYELTVFNLGSNDSSGTISVVDVLPVGITIADGAVPLTGAQAADWNCTAAADVLTCTSSTVIASAASSSFAFATTVTGLDGTEVNNKARVGGGGDPHNPPPTATSTATCTADDNPAGCAVDTDTINAPLLSLGKSDSRDHVRAGDSTTYSLTVGNIGSLSTSSIIRVVDVLPGGMSYGGTSPFSSGGFTCNYTASSLSLACESSASLAAGASATISFTVDVAGSATSALTNRAQVGGGGDPGKSGLPTPTTVDTCPAPIPPATTFMDLSSGCASDLDLVRHVSLTLDKNDGQLYFAINGQTTYVFTLSNSGDIASTGDIHFRDVLPAPMTWPNPLIVAGANAADWACVRDSDTEASCSTSSVIAVGMQSQFSLLANVGAATANTEYTNKARVAGGGAADLPDTLIKADVTACTGNNNPLGCSIDADTAQATTQIRLAKSHRDPQSANPGDTLTFDLLVTNSGGLASDGADTIRVIDVLPASLSFFGTTPFSSGQFSCNVLLQVITCNNTAVLAAGANSTITFTATVGTGSSNTLTNPAQVGSSGADPQNASFPTAATVAQCVADAAPHIGCAVDVVPLNADLQIIKKERIGSTGAFSPGPLSMALGQTVEFQIELLNNGPATVDNAVISDSVPTQFGLVSIISATPVNAALGCSVSDFSLTGSNLSGTIASLPSGASCTLLLQAITASTGTDIVNTATVNVPASITDTNPANNVSHVTASILPLPTIQVSKISLGGTGTYGFTGDNGYGTDSITTSSSGVAQAGATRSLASSDVITSITESAPPAGSALLSVDCSGLGNGSSTLDLATRTVTFNAAATAPGAVIQCTFTNSNQATIHLQKVLAGNRLSGVDQFDLLISGAASPVTITTTGSGSAITSAAATLSATVGTTYSLSEAMANGSVSALSYYVTSIACNNASTGSNTILPSGQDTRFDITPLAAGDDISCILTNNPRSVADLSLSKTDNSTSYTPGGTVTYTIVASNAGPGDVSGATVEDSLPASISSASWTSSATGGASSTPATGNGNINATVDIPVGGSVTYSLTGTVDSASTGDLVNTATITPPQGTIDPHPGNGSATDTDTTVNASADLSVVKTAPASVEIGGNITWNVLVTNKGPSNADGALFSDPVPAGVTAVTATCGAATAGAMCGAVTVSNNTVSSTISALPVNGTVTFSISGTAPTHNTQLLNTASVSPPAGVVEADDTDNSSSANTNITIGPALQVPVDTRSLVLLLIGLLMLTGMLSMRRRHR